MPGSRALSPLCYGVGVTPAKPPTSRRFLKSRPPKNSITNNHAPLRPLPCRGLSGRIFARLAACAVSSPARRSAATAARCSRKNWCCAYTRSKRCRHPLGLGAPSHSRRASRCSGNLGKRVRRSPWLLRKPWLRAGVLALSCLRLCRSRWRCRVGPPLPLRAHAPRATPHGRPGASVAAYFTTSGGPTHRSWLDAGDD
jgi:hypothetical protein